MALEVGEPLPPALRSAVVLDAKGAARQLADVVGATALVVFLRHFGCIGCADHVHALLPRLAELDALGVRVVLVGSGPPEHIAAFVEQSDLAGKPAIVVTDPSLAAFRAARLRRSFWATYGPTAIVDFARAFARGHRPRPTDGDLYQQGGAVLVDDAGVVVWSQASETLGDHADPSEAVDAALRLGARRAGVLV